MAEGTPKVKNTLTSLYKTRRKERENDDRERIKKHLSPVSQTGKHPGKTHHGK